MVLSLQKNEEQKQVSAGNRKVKNMVKFQDPNEVQPAQISVTYWFIYFDQTVSCEVPEAFVFNFWRLPSTFKHLKVAKRATHSEVF